MHCKSKITPIGILRIIGFALGGLALAALFALLFGYIVMQLWNWLMVSIFGLSAITFWQAVGIIILAKLLFGGFHPGGHHKRKAEHIHHNPFHAWKDEKEYMMKNRHMLKKFWECEGKSAFEKFKTFHESDENPESDACDS